MAEVAGSLLAGYHRRPRMIASRLLLLLSLAASANPADTLSPEPGWPRWTETRAGLGTRQTSGLAFVGRSAGGERVFLAADDTGSLWRLIVPDRGALRLEPIPFRGAAAETLARFPKRDLEGISCAPGETRILLSIEGNTPSEASPDSAFREWLGIFEATLDDVPARAHAVRRLARMQLPEWAEATRLARPNRGFEGIALVGGTLLLGLEGSSAENGAFADSTLIEVYDLANGTRSEIGMGAFGIATITGLDPGPRGRIYGVDRNRLRLFSFTLAGGGAIDFRSVPIAMPGVRGVAYRLPSPESIAVDDSGFVWIAVDPWVYEPVGTAGLARRDVENYRRQVPLLYKYRDPFATALDR